MPNGLFGTNIAETRIRQTALQPAAIPGSTYVRPQQQEVGRNLAALAQALGGMNSALQGFAQRQEQQQKDPNSDLNREWIAKRQQMTLEQLREEARIGSPDGIRARQDALDALLGEKQNDAFRQRWVEFYNTEFDQSRGDMSAAFEQMRSEYAANLPSEISRGNFYRLTEPYFGQWQQEDTKQKVGFVKEQINTTVVASFRNANDDMAAAGKTPEERATAIFAASASNRDFLEMSGQEQNDTLYALAQEFALKGDKDMVAALLRGTRVGADGRTLPPLATIPKYSTDSLKLIEQATSQWHQKASEESLSARLEADELVNGGAFTATEAEKRRTSGIWRDPELAQMVEQSTNVRLREQARFEAEQAKAAQRFRSDQEEQAAAVQTLGMLGHYGGVGRVKDVQVEAREGDGLRTITAKSLIEQATNMFEERMTAREEQLVQAGASPEAAAQRVFKERLAFYSSNKLDNPEWANVLNGIASRGTVEALLERGAVAQEIGRQADLYRELLAANPAYLSTLLTDPKAKEFLEVYDNALTNRRMPKEAALHFAATRVAMPESMRAKDLLGPQKTTEIAQRTLRDLGLDDDRGSNAAYVVTRIQDLAMGNMTENEIRDRIKKEIEDTSVNINGILVPDHRDLPQDFPVLMEAELQGAFEVFGKQYGMESVKDLAVVPVSGQSKWQVIDKRTGFPIGTSYVTPQSLDVQRKMIAHEQDLKTIEMIRASDAERAAKQAIYDADIQGMRDNIAKYRKRKGAISQGIADYLQGVLDDRLAHDAWLKTRTPEQLEKEAQEHLDALQKKIQLQTGDRPDLYGL